MAKFKKSPPAGHVGSFNKLPNFANKIKPVREALKKEDLLRKTITVLKKEKRN